jgi:hypothetical protein
MRRIFSKIHSPEYIRSMQDGLAFDSIVGRFTDAPVGLNMHFLEVPAGTVKRLGTSLPSRYVITVGDQHWHGAVMSMGDGRGFIMLNRQLMKACELSVGSRAKVRLVPDTSRYGMPISEELSEVLRQDPEADERFHALTPGRQRNIIHYVNRIRDPQIRIDKSLMLMSNLKSLPRGKEPMGRILGFSGSRDE